MNSPVHGSIIVDGEDGWMGEKKFYCSHGEVVYTPDFWIFKRNKIWIVLF